LTSGLVNFGLPPNRPNNWQVELYTPIQNKLKFLKPYFHNPAYDITSWSVVVEYFHRYNPYTGSMLHTLERVIAELHAGTNKAVTVKACNTQMVHSSKSPIFKLNFPDDELKYLQDKIDLDTLKLLKRMRPPQQQNVVDDQDLPEPFESDNDHHAHDVHMESPVEDNNDQDTDGGDRPPKQSTTRQLRRRQPAPSATPIPTKRSRREATRGTKGGHRSQKEHSKRLI
jgi:hypothetical protein